MPELDVNGRRVRVAEGASVAAAVAVAGVASRVSVHGEPRGPLCGMGICYECRVEIDGRPHERSCQIPAAAGMQVVCAAPPPEASAGTSGECVSPPPFDLLIVGGGPAGIAAACVGAEAGLRVAVADDNPGLGGQIWRGSVPGAWRERLARAAVTFHPSCRITHAPGAGALAGETAAGGLHLRYRALLVATGARERFLPFPGWTLPNVTGAGGLQALVKSGLPIAGRRVLVAGTGPLLLAVAAYLRRQGARVLGVCEQAPRGAAADFALGLWRYPGKLAEAARLAPALAGVRVRFATWPVEARGRERLESVALNDGSEIALDYLACGFHLVPNLELAQLLGCRMEPGPGTAAVAVDEEQQTSIGGVYCAGEPTGIGGLELALVEGEIAALAAAGRPARHLFSRRARLRRFAAALGEVCRLRPELRALPRPGTPVCRCEDVAHEALAAQSGWRQAKLQTRCGMGPCQGRVCGPALEFLHGWSAGGIRPPVFPTPIAALRATGNRGAE